MNISTDVHRVKAISVRAGTLCTGTTYTEFTLVTDDGEFTLSAFSKAPLSIEGGEFVNFVATAEAPE